MLWLTATLLAATSERTLDVFSDPGARSVYNDQSENSAINWIGSSRKRFTCLFLRADGTHRCGIDISFGDGRRSGIDVSEYATARLAIKYEGPADKLRFSFRNAFKEATNRNAMADFSYIENAKYHSTILPIRRGAYVYDIPLNTLEVASWWIAQTETPDDERRTPDRSNVVHMGFDIQNPMPIGQHHFEVIELTLVAPWLSAANAAWWFVFSALYFVVIGLLYNFFRLKSRIQEHNEEMFGLLGRLKEADSKSAHFKTLAMYDPLTDLLNRRAALDLVKDFAQRNSLAGTALILLDIDHFKMVNDVYGHDVGDEVLQSVSGLILQSLRVGDAAVRWGGEEILVICPKTKPEGAGKVAEKLRSQIAELRFLDSGLTISASFGVANIAVGDSFEQTFRRADEALYRAKNSGRNRVCYEQEQAPAA